MEPILPTGGPPGPQPTGDPVEQQAKRLAHTIGAFVEGGYTIFQEPAHINDGEFMEKFAGVIRSLHQQCCEVKGR